MSASTNRMLIWIGLALVLGAAIWRVLPREQLTANGDPLLLEIRPVDPRALLQGDYMALDYEIEQEAEQDVRTLDPEVSSIRRVLRHDGLLILSVDERGVGSYARLGQDADPASEAPGADEIAVRYRMSVGDVDLGQRRWFFQEGQAEIFQEAEYAEMRVDSAGRLILVGMRDEALRPLGEPLARW